jgi:PKD repeat protein
VASVYNLPEPTLAATTGITVATDDSSYVLRETALVGGDAIYDGSPASDMLVAMEIRDPPDVVENPLLFRTLPIGSPDESWLLDITGMHIYHPSTWEQLDTVKTGMSYLIGATVRNPLGVNRSPVVVVVTAFDGNTIPLGAFKAYEGSIEAETSISTYNTVFIPQWAYSGEASIYCSVYDQLPSEGGIPYAPEKIAEFHITRTQEGQFGQIPLPMQTHSSSGTTGTYDSLFRLSPEPEPGTYTVYVVGRYSPITRATNTTTFEVVDIESPPQASFIFSPLEPYPNQTVTFDASSSSAEGFGDYIVSYEWNFGDGNTTTITEDIISHRFMASTQYLVTLNVTDSEGFWSTTQKPVNVRLPNPVANFTWYPLTPGLGTGVTFNATSSQPGWSVSQGQYTSIVSYEWNFGDSPFNVTVTEPTIIHEYNEPGNMTVRLKVTDSIGQTGTVNYIVEVENRTSPPWDINGDGVTDIKDIAIVAKAYGSIPGMPNWNPDADITGPTPLVPDGKVDIRDIALVSSHFGE